MPWTRTHTERRGDRFPVCEDDRKGGLRSYDGGKKINGRKRHILVDTQGLVLKVVVHEVIHVNHFDRCVNYSGRSDSSSV